MRGSGRCQVQDEYDWIHGTIVVELWGSRFEVKVREVGLNDCTQSPPMCSVALSLAVVKVVGSCRRSVCWRDLVIATDIIFVVL